jgi:hypothetical protein
MSVELANQVLKKVQETSKADQPVLVASKIMTVACSEDQISGRKTFVINRMTVNSDHQKSGVMKVFLHNLIQILKKSVVGYDVLEIDDIVNPWLADKLASYGFAIEYGHTVKATYLLR